MTEYKGTEIENITIYELKGVVVINLVDKKCIKIKAGIDITEGYKLKAKKALEMLEEE